VDRFFAALARYGRDVRELAGVRIAAIGPATAASIERRCLRVAVQPSEYRAEALLEALGEVSGKRILIARAAQAREVLPETLAARGAWVDVVPVYETVLPEAPAPTDRIGGADVVTFTSSSTVRNFLRLAGEVGRRVLAQATVAAIGPITAQTLEEAGFRADVVAEPYTIEALVDAIVRHVAKRTGAS